jgi:hypothetical protein
MLSVAMTGGTSHPMLVRIAEARKINQLCNGAVIHPWDDDLFGYLEITGWMDAFRAMQSGLPKIQEGLSRIEARKRAIIARHPAYRH